MSGRAIVTCTRHRQQQPSCEQHTELMHCLLLTAACVLTPVPADTLNCTGWYMSPCITLCRWHHT